MALFKDKAPQINKVHLPQPPARYGSGNLIITLNEGTLKEKAQTNTKKISNLAPPNLGSDHASK